MDLEQKVLELRKRINKLRTELDLNPSTQHKTLDDATSSSTQTQLDENTSSSSSANDIKAALLANKRKT